MGKRSPGRFVREGRRAFFPDGDPKEMCPYEDVIWDSRFENWMDGWTDADADYWAQVHEDANMDATVDGVINRIYAGALDPDLRHILIDLAELIKR